MELLVARSDLPYFLSDRSLQPIKILWLPWPGLSSVSKCVFVLFFVGPVRRLFLYSIIYLFWYRQEHPLVYRLACGGSRKISKQFRIKSSSSIMVWIYYLVAVCSPFLADITVSFPTMLLFPSRSDNWWVMGYYFCVVLISSDLVRNQVRLVDSY